MIDNTRIFGCEWKYRIIFLSTINLCNMVNIDSMWYIYSNQCQKLLVMDINLHSERESFNFVDLIETNYYSYVCLK